MTLLDEHNQTWIASEFANVARTQMNAACYDVDSAMERLRLFILLKPKMYADGNQWCTLYGDSIQDGVCGFGDTPELASLDFDKNWKTQKLVVN